MEREQTTIRLPAELKEQLQQEAEKKGDVNVMEILNNLFIVMGYLFFMILMVLLIIWFVRIIFRS